MYGDEQRQLVVQMEKAAQTGDFNATVIGVVDDFANDARICLTSVAFVPPEIATIITQKIIEPLRAIEPGHYYYPAESMHVTIKNVQVISDPPTYTEADVQKVHAMMQAVVPQANAFSFVLEGVTQFPTSVSVIGYCDERLQSLVWSLDRNLQKIGLPDNKKYFSDSIFFGNISVCRFLHEPGAAFKTKLKELSVLIIGEMLVKEISLITCNSVCYPNSLRVFGTYSLK